MVLKLVSLISRHVTTTYHMNICEGCKRVLRMNLFFILHLKTLFSIKSTGTPRTIIPRDMKKELIDWPSATRWWLATLMTSRPPRTRTGATELGVCASRL